MNLIERAQLHSPWKLANEVKRLLVLPFVRLLFLWSGIRWGNNWRIYGIPIIQKNRYSTLEIGARLMLRSSTHSNPLAPNRPVVLSTISAQARLEIGDDFGMTGGSVVCKSHIKIGNRVAVGANSIIADTDFHPLDPDERRRDFLAGATAPVVIEDDVFVGMQSIILKGVTIGSGSVVGAGSVVTRNVPPGVVVAGNPAQVIKKLDAHL